MKKTIIKLLGIAALSFLALSSCADLLNPPAAVTWDADATDHRANVGSTYTYTLPAGGTESQIWGTDIYTDDSSIGTAAVHKGLISYAAGGKVTIRIVVGQSSYTGSTRYGVTSLDYGPWDGSFEFVTN